MIPYNPCGAVVEWGRFRYRRPCRFFKDDPARVDEVIWYPAAPHARALPFPSAINQLVNSHDDTDWDWGDEIGEVPNSPKVIDHMKPIPLAIGQHQCGTATDFAEGAEYDPDAHYPYRADGLPECCPGEIGGVEWGGQMPIPPEGGIEWGGQFEIFVLEIPPAGVVVPVEQPIVAQFPTFGLARGGRAITNGPFAAGTWSMEWEMRTGGTFYEVYVYYYPSGGGQTLAANAFTRTGCLEWTLPAGVLAMAYVFGRVNPTIDPTDYVSFRVTNAPC